ncbi:MAG TPA: RpiB/LacA/LacB family sugar-phosphate isomerase [Actinomycetota bacterium]|nr:RpiB/LacA/LacB family sugar-phosphate isomerase [Actinomycetota bacterium]
MRVAIGSDERTPTTDAVIEALRERGLELELHGPIAPGDDRQWAEVSETVARAVSEGRAEQGILFCWTGTGCSIAANKVPGVRAALCTDAETARGARRWNDANVLAMSLRLATPILAREIVDAWLQTREVDPDEVPNIDRVRRLEEGA